MEGGDERPGGRRVGLLKEGPALPHYPLAFRRRGLAFLALAVTAVIYGNGVAALPNSQDPRYDWALNLGFLLVVLAAAIRWAGLTWSDIGFRGQGWGRGALLGLGIAAVVILPVALYLAFPFGLPGGTIDYERTEELSLSSFLIWALLRQPIGTSLFEETVFRGVLQALSVRAYGLVRGILLSALAFGLWHLVVNFRTVQDTNVGESVALASLAQLAAMAGIMVGAVFMSVLRQRSGNLAAPIAFHWLVVVAMQGTLFALAD